MEKYINMRIKPVQNMNEILDNIETFDYYLTSKEYYEYVKELFKKDSCLIIMKKDGVFKFCPYRFVGFANNSKEQHERNFEIDGRMIKPYINDALKQKPKPNEKYDIEYNDLCKRLELHAHKSYRIDDKLTYWEITDN